MTPKVSIVNHNPVIAMRKYIYPIVIFSKYDFVLKENKDDKQKHYFVISLDKKITCSF